MELNRIRWASRRGMLELDLILQPFIENSYSALSREDQQRYQKLLDEQDVDLFAWLLNHQIPPNQELQRIVQIVRDSVSSKSP
ncbi:MAG: antitoxin CptB [Cellvibrionaceae bacterium]|jgi:antitoxin CptB